MKINSERLFLTDVYSYDISACHFRILRGLGVDVSGIDFNNKKERNIKIGLLMRDNPNLTSILRTVTESTITEYLIRNKISDKDIVVRQYDGILTTRRLVETDTLLPLELKGVFEKLIISYDRKKYIGLINDETVVKGIQQRYETIDKLYEKLLRIPFIQKDVVFSSLQKFRESFLFSKDTSIFFIPESEKEGVVFLKQFGPTRISKAISRAIDPDEVDKQYYWKFYFEPFTKSIVKEFI